MDTLGVMKENKTPVSAWLDTHFLKWQMASGGSRTLTEFAVYLGVSRDSLNNWINRGSKPEKTSVDVLASKLEDLTIYDLMDFPRPDIRLKVVLDNWGEVADDVKDQVVSIIQRAKIRKSSETTSSRVEQPHRK